MTKFNLAERLDAILKTHGVIVERDGTGTAWFGGKWDTPTLGERITGHCRSREEALVSSVAALLRAASPRGRPQEQRPGEPSEAALRAGAEEIRRGPLAGEVKGSPSAAMARRVYDAIRRVDFPSSLPPQPTDLHAIARQMEGTWRGHEAELWADRFAPFVAEMLRASSLPPQPTEAAERVRAIRGWLGDYGFQGGAKEDVAWLLNFAEGLVGVSVEPSEADRRAKRAAYVMAMRLMQSDFYDTADDELRAAIDASVMGADSATILADRARRPLTTEGK
jgi:hypothetical protein